MCTHWENWIASLNWMNRCIYWLLSPYLNINMWWVIFYFFCFRERNKQNLQKWEWVEFRTSRPVRSCCGCGPKLGLTHFVFLWDLKLHNVFPPIDWHSYISGVSLILLIRIGIFEILKFLSQIFIKIKVWEKFWLSAVFLVLHWVSNDIQITQQKWPQSFELP